MQASQDKPASAELTTPVESGIEGVPETAWIDVIRKMEAVYTDLVSSQVEVEEKNAALESAQRFIRSVLSGMTDVLIVCDMRGGIEQVNAAVRDLTGKDESELLGSQLVSLFDNESRARIEAAINATSGSEFHDEEVGLLSASGEPFLLAMTCSDRHNADGKAVGKIWIGRSIGELHRAYRELNEAHQSLQQTQAQLVQSEKMASLGRLVAGVAHELNNPISFVFGNMTALRSYEQRLKQFLEAIDEGLPPEVLQSRREDLKIDRIVADMDSLIDGSIEGAERVRDIVQSLRRYSTPQKESAVDFDIADAIRTAVRWVSRGTRHEVETHYDRPDEQQIRGNKGTVHQILMNLVQNAIDVMDETDRPRIDIDCSIDESDVTIRVRDYGPGIPDSAMPKLFDPFYTTKPVGKGTGLGLSISYGLATNQGGALSAANHPEGGAVFSLRLPLEFDDGSK